MPNGLAGKTEKIDASGCPAELDSPFFLSIDRASLLPAQEVLERFESDASLGLGVDEAGKRLERFGSNELGKKAQVNPIRLFVSQFISTVVALLLVAAIVSEMAGEHLQAAGIAIAVLINAIVGFITEYKAQVSLAALEKLAGPVARVRRAGQDFEIPVCDLVPGDILIMEEGSRVPADVRLISAAALSLDESMLSGESIPVYKSSDLGDATEQITVAFQGSLILKGRAKAVVVATGGNTKLGQLGHSLSAIRAKSTPLQDDLEKLGRQLSVFTVVVCAVLFGLGLLHGEKFWEMVQVSIALAVAAIPEGLPVVATLALASGTNRMVKLGALIRKLSAVETLGCTEIICTDKTGTLTQNQMTVTDIVIDGRHLNVSGLGYTPEGDFSENDCLVEERSFLKPVLTAAVLCNDAKLEMHEDARWHIHGDPTEGALLTVGLKAGIEQKSSKEELPRHNEFPFELSRKRMTTIHQRPAGDFLAYTKGASETVLALCKNYLSADGVVEFDQARRDWFVAKNLELANKGLRVLGLAARDLGVRKVKAHADAESDMTFLGLIGMSDRPKEGVLEAIEECKRAGIKVIMLTGDHPATAMSIARDLNILSPEGQSNGVQIDNAESSTMSQVVVGRELEKMDEQAIGERLKECTVLARVQPEAKLSIVRALQSSGRVVAMTGDGINDAPALQQSDIGVAMGQSGTSLAREASDMVITDDNFPTIVHAIEQGRVIYSNISCAVAYLLTASLASVVTVAAAVVFDTGLPLSPLQLLWLNLIMHIFPGLGLVLQRARPGIMQEAPRGRKQSLLGRKEYAQIVMRGVVVALLTVIAAENVRGQSIEYIRTIVLSTISLSLLLQSWAWLAVKRPADDWSYLTSGAMYINTLLGIGLLLVAVLFPPMQAILGTVCLTAAGWSAVVLYAFFSYFLTAVLKDY